MAISQINDAVQQISKVTQMNSATSEETASSSEEMSSQAETLKERVAQFKLKRKNNNNIFLDDIEQKEIMSNKQFVAATRFNATPNINLEDVEFGKY